MENTKTKATVLILISGILNCLLAVAHQIVLYSTYKDYQAVITPETLIVLKDMVLFSMGIGVTLLLTGLLSIYIYRGVKQNARWAHIIGWGVSALLLSFSLAMIFVMGIDQPIAYVHLLNSLLVAIPLFINRKAIM